MGGVGDSNPFAGSITYIGAVGSIWNINVDIGSTKPFVGTSRLPQMSYSFLSMSNAASNLTIKFGETDFTNPGGGIDFHSTFSGKSAGNVGFELDYSNANVLFGGTMISSIGPLGPGGFGTNDSSIATPGSLYSLTLVATIHHDSAGLSGPVGTVTTTAVPEPGTLLLLGAGLLGLVVVGRKKFRR